MNRSAQLMDKVATRLNKKRALPTSLARPEPRRRFLFEALEPRLLLSATPFYTAAATQAGVDLTLRVDNQSGVDTLQLIDSVHGGVMASAAVASLTAPIVIEGSRFDDILRIGSDLGAITGGILFDAGSGKDTLSGPSADTTWQVTGDDAGQVNGLAFSGVEDLAGAAGNKDTFIFGAGGGLSGVVEGGTQGFDTVVLNGAYQSVAYVVTGADSGIIELDGVGIHFGGMEPVQFTQAAGTFTYAGTIGNDTISLHDIADAGGFNMEISGTGETVQFANPTVALVINGLAGADTITIESLDAAFSADLQVYGRDNSPPGLVSELLTDTVSFTGNISTNGGYLEVFAERITVADNVTLSTKDPSDPDGTNDIVFRARYIGTAALELLTPVAGSNRAVSIDIGKNAVLDGAGVYLIAQAEDRTFSQVLGIDRRVDTFVIQPLQNQVSNLAAMPVKILVKISDAKVTLQEGAKLLGEGTVGVYATAAADATGVASSKLFSIGYSQANASAVIDVQRDVVIDAGDAAVVNATAGATASMSTATERELGSVPGGAQFAISLAVSNANVTSRTSVAQGASISAGKTANVLSSGNIESEAEAESGLFSNGQAGLAFGVEFSGADVHTTVNGSIKANMDPGSTVKLEIDPTVTDPTKVGYVDYANNRINVGAHALVTEDSIEYSARRGRSISGLINGQEYVVIALEDDASTLNIDESQFIQLANSEREAIAGQAIDLLPGGALAASNNGKNFDSTQVDGTKDTISLNNPAFTNAGTVDYSFLGLTFELGQPVVYHQSAAGPIAGLVDGQTYYVITGLDEFDLQGDSRFIQKQVIQLAETENEARAGVAINIGAAPTGATGYRFEAKHVLDSGFATGVGVISKLGAKDSASAESGLQKTPATGATDDATGFDPSASIFDNIFTALTQRYSANASKPNTGASSTLNVSGALAFSFANHSVLTDVGGTADFESNADVEAKATIEEALKLSAESTTVLGPGGNVQNTVSVAASIGAFQNTAKTTVETGARLDALGATRVIALVEYPYLTSPDEFIPSTLGEFVDSLQSEGYDALNKYMDGTLGLKSSLFNTWSRSTAAADQIGIAGSVNFLSLANTAEALVKTGVQINQDAAFRGAANTHPNNTGEQTVSVEASNYSQLIDLAGVFDLRLPSVVIDPLSPEFDPKLAISPVGASGKRGGVGGAIALKFLTNTTKATVEDGAAIFSGSDGGFNMKADEAVFGIDLAQSGASSTGKFAIGGSVQYTEQVSNTLALLGSGAFITGRSATLYAASLETQATWTGGVAKGQALGVGAAVSINRVERNTRASIGNPDKQTSTGVIGAQTSIDVSDDVNVRAIANSHIWSFTLAGTLVSTLPDKPEVPPNVPLKAQKILGTDAPPPPTGLGIAAAVSINVVNDTTQASIVDAGLVKAENVKITSEYKGQIVAATGSAAIVSGSGAQQGSAALAGAFSLNDLRINSRAYIVDTNLEAGGNLEVSATNGSELIAISAGGAGNTTQQGIAVAGSVSINQIIDTTEAFVAGVTATIAGDVSVTATDSSRIIAVGGGAAFGGRAGVGIGVGANILGSDALPNVTQAYIENSVLTIGGAKLDILATNVNPTTDPRIIAFGAGIGVGGNNSLIGLGAMLSVNLITANTRAYARSSTFTDDRNPGVALVTNVKARDNSGIITFSGAVGVSKTNAIGAAISYAEIDNDTLAYFDNVDLDAAGALTIDATSQSVIGNLTLGVAAVTGNQGSLAGAGSISINLITNTIDAHIGNSVDNASTITTGGDVTLTAKDDSQLVSLAGGVAVTSKGVAVGAAVSYNLIQNTIKAYVDNATVDAQGATSSIDLSASSDSTLVSVAVGVGASAGNFGFGGSLTVNSIANTIDAHIANSTSITAGENVTVNATESDTLVTVAGGFAAATGGGGNAVGAAIAYNYIGGSFDPANPNVVNRSSTTKDQVTAYIDNAHVVAGGDIVVAAGYRQSTDPIPTTLTLGGETVALPQEVKSRLVSVTVGGAAADQFALGGAVSINVVAHDITAYISGTRPVEANGSILVSASDDLVMTSIAGGVALGQNAVGAGVSTQITKNNVEAHIGEDAIVDARGNGAGVAAPNGTKNANGVPQGTIVKGLAVTATSFEDTFTLAIGGAAGARFAVAGSAAVTVLNETTKAYIAENARINQGTANEAADQSVVVLASDRTEHTGVGGSLAIGGKAGIGAGIDVGVITKNTEARIGSGAGVEAQAHVQVLSLSQEDVTSVAAGVGGGGAVGIGGGVDVYVVDVTTRALIEGAKSLVKVYPGATVTAGGSVQVAAEDKNEMDVIGGSLALGGGVGVGGAASIPIVKKTTEAFIGNGAIVNALGNGAGIATRSGDFTVGLGAYSTAEGEVKPVDTGNSDATDSSLTQQRTATANTRTGFRGVAVTAVNQDDIATFGVGAGGGGVGVQVSAAVNVMTTKTHAYIGDNAQVNQVTAGENAAQSVLVAAGNDYSYLGVAGGLAVAGSVAVTPGVNVGVATHDTRAYVGKSAKVDAKQDVSVAAQAQEDILSIAAALAGSGSVSVAGAVSVIVLNNTTHAFIDSGATVRADGNVLVSASDVTDLDAIAGALGVGFTGGGAGAGIGVNKINKDTQAYVALGAVVNAGAISPQSLLVYDELDKTAGVQSKSIKGVAVQATSSEDVFLAAAAGGAGGFVGLAGGVSVNLITANTRAYLGESSNTTSAGSVNVAAYDNVKLLGIAGSLAIGGAVSASGGVDVGIVRNDTQAFIGDNARVSATGTVGVNAFSVKDVDSFAVSAAGGVGASLAAAVSVYSIGADLSQDARTALTGSAGDTLAGTLDGQANAAQLRSLLSKYGYAPDSDIGDAVGDASASLNVPSTSSDLNQPVTGATRAKIGFRANVSAGDDINVRAKQQLSFDAAVGQGAFGFVSLGGSVVVANITEDAQASIEPFALVSAGPDAGDDINVEATLFEKGINGKAFAGNVGYVSLGAQVVILNDSSRQLAYIDQGTIISRADHLNVLASAERPAQANAGGVGVGGVAAGAAIGKINLTGSTTAFIGDSKFTSKPATIRLIVNYVNVTADSAATAKADMFQGAGGIGAGAGNDASAIVTPTVTAFIAGNTNTQAKNTVSITARSEDDASAQAYGVDVGGVSVGVSNATATASPVLDAFLGKGAFMTAGQDFIVQAVHNYKVTQDAQGTRRPITETNPARVQRPGDVAGNRHPDDQLGVLRDYGAYATSFAASGNLVGGNGATSTANASAQLSTHVDTGAVISAGRDVSVLSLSLNDSHALSSGVTFSVVAGGGSKTANANSLGSTRTFVDGRISKGVNFDVQALAVDTGNAVTDATAAAIGGAGQNSTSTTNVKPVLVARIGTQSLNPISALDLSNSTIDLGYAHGYANGQGLIYDNGNPKDKAVFDPTKAGVISSNTIALGGNYILGTGNEVVYRSGGGAAIGIGGGQRLVEGKVYYVIATADPNKIRLAATAADAAAGNALTLDASVATGKLHSVDSNRTSLRINPAAPVTTPYLINGKTYFVIAVAGSPTKIKLAETAADALAGKAITFDRSLPVFVALAAGAFGTQQSFTPPGATPFANVSGNVKVLSNSFTDGDATASGTAGSVGISVGLTNAFTTVSPTITTFVGQNGSITALGNVTVQSQQGNAITSSTTSNGQFDPSTAVQTGSNAITLTGHGFDTGAQAIYARNGGGDIGLEDQRAYNVIKIDANTLKLGDQFVAANVDAAQDRITFAQSHSFKSGDEVIYDNGGGANTGGLTGGNRYFVKVVDGRTIQLFANKADASADPVVFSASAVNANKITLPAGASFTDGQIVTYSTTGASFNDGIVGIKVNADGTRTPAPNTIFFGADYFKTHALNTGERIRYHTDNKPLTGLVNDTDYFVINNGDGSISLATTAANAAAGTKLPFSVAPTDHTLGTSLFTSADVSNDNKGGAIKLASLAGLATGQQLTYDAQNGVAIGGLVDGANYFVIIDSTLPNTVRLAASASLAQSGVALNLNASVGSQHIFNANGSIAAPGNYRVINNADGTISLAALSGPLTAITLNPAGVFGTQSLSISPIDLTSAANANAQSLSIALKSTADTTKATLLKQGSVNINLGSGAADGIATATANAAAFSLLGSGTGSETKVTVQANVNTFVDKKTIISGKDVSVLSSSSASLGTTDTNKTGAFVAATNPLASSSMTNNNKAYLGSDVIVNASGKFNIDSRVAQSSTLFVRAEAGAGIALAGANNDSQGASVSYNNNAIIGQNVQVTAIGTVDAQASASNTISLRVEADGRGFGANGKAKVFLNATGGNLVEVQDKAKLSGTVVSLNADTVGSIGVSTDATSAGFASEAVAQSTLNANLSNTVRVGGKTSITGGSAVNLNARTPLLVAVNGATTHTIGVFSGGYPETFGSFVYNSSVAAPSDARFITNSLSHSAGGAVLPIVNATTRDVQSIDFGRAKNEATASVSQTDQFAGTVLSFPQPLRATAASTVAPAGTMLAQAALDATVASAISQWKQSGQLDQAQFDQLKQVRFHIEELDGAYLGLAAGTDISIDRDAAGYGWFVDKTPTRSEEFGKHGAAAGKANPAAGRMDLLSVVNHEIGHVLGLEDAPRGDTPQFMDETLAAGERISPFDSGGTLRVFDAESGQFKNAARAAAGTEDEFVRISDERVGPRERFYAMETGKWRSQGQQHKHA